MAGALIQISAMKGVPATARYAVRLIALILVQLKLESISEVVANTMEKSFEALLAKTVEKVTDSLKDSIESSILEIRAASTNVATSATQIAATTTSYRDALKKSLGLAGGPTPWMSVFAQGKALRPSNCRLTREHQGKVCYLESAMSGWLTLPTRRYRAWTAAWATSLSAPKGSTMVVFCWK